MKRVLLILLAFAPVAFLQAQVCEPNPVFTDTTGVFPIPKVDSIPGSGITECAVIGEPYNFTLTIVVGDSLTLPILGRRPLDKVTVTNVTGFPAGITYACEPGNCIFEESSNGCAVLTGTALASNAPGDYQLTVFVTIKFADPQFPQSVDVTFPGSAAPGEYILRLLATNTEECGLVSSTKTLNEQVSVSISPNPTTGPVQVNINADVAGDFKLRVVDLLGQAVHHQAVAIQTGSNQVSFDGSSLANGLYIVVLENELGAISQKLRIQH